LNIKKVLIVIFLVIGGIGGYFVYKHIQNLDYEEIEEEILFSELVKDSSEKKTQEKNIIEGKNETDSEQEIETEEIQQNKIVIHIAGEVVNDGVFELNEGSRVVDAVNIAGGLTENADVSKINLAYILSDEMKIYIPNKKEEINDNFYKEEIEYISKGSGDNVVERKEEQNKEENILVNINEATQTELETLPGIGPSTAL